MKQTTIVEQECDECNGSGWDDQCGDKCDTCGASGTAEYTESVDIADPNQYILDILGTESWNGIAVNGTPFTQWNANESFFELFKKNKEEIKNMGYSLYKHEMRGWVVTLFDQQVGRFESYESYKGVTQ